MIKCILFAKLVEAQDWVMTVPAAAEMGATAAIQAYSHVQNAAVTEEKAFRECILYLRRWWDSNPRELF